MNKNSNDMEDKIFDIVTDLLRNDITKSEAIDKLLFLCEVGISVKEKYTPTFEEWCEKNVDYKSGDWYKYNGRWMQNKTLRKKYKTDVENQP